MSYHYGSPKPMRKYDVNDHQVRNLYQHCNCCPYGYHIDLDFVRYCENIYQGLHRTESFKKRKDRRRQRQSMEVLLGIEPQNLLKLENENVKSIKEERQIFSDESFRKNAELINDALDEVVSDFERTWKGSHKLSTNLSDVTAVNVVDTISHAPSVSSISSNSGSFMVLPSASEDAVSNHDYDLFNIDTSGLNSVVLQNIRDQVAVSLERTKELEERIKLIPKLQVELNNLKRENANLISKLKQEEKENHWKVQNENFRPPPPLLHFGKLESVSENGIPPIPPPRKDFSVMCSVFTRNIGVGHHHPSTKSVSTCTFEEDMFRDKLEFLEKNSQKLQGLSLIINRDTQTPIIIKKDIFSQTSYVLKENRLTQTVKNVNVRNSGVLATPLSAEVGITVKIPSKDTGVSEDTINDILCSKCNCTKTTIGVGPDNEVDGQFPVSLSLLFSRSKSFNLGGEHLNFRQKQRTVACQYEIEYLHKSSQSSVKTLSKGCQHLTNTSEKSVQCKREETGLFSTHVATNTDRPVVIKKKSIACNTSVQEVKNKDVACNTSEETLKTSEIGCGTEDIFETPGRKENLRMKEKEKEKEDIKTEDVGAFSRIPRLQTDVRRFRRQDTYTKLSEPVRGPRRLTPSKEMQGALKVLNDSLQKGLNRNLKNQLKNAIDIIKQEWFDVSSVDSANPMEVEGYLDYFEAMSSKLLEYIVNMPDASGNTAMHYSVSHGNFDVVSILLDSKVCDINKTNTAGYTSVMLVSLAELQNLTHMEVVRRLFQLADVNIKAQQHGQTALMLAVSHGRIDMVNMLLEAGADINIQDEDGSTALMCAAEHGHIDIVKLFLGHPDCDSSITDVDGSTALKIAMEAGHRHIGVLLYAHERNIEAADSGKLRKSKSVSLSPRTQSSPRLSRKHYRPVQEWKSNEH